MSKNTPKDNSVGIHPGYAMEYYKIKAFFEDDPTFKVSELDDVEKACTITVNDTLKGEILKLVLNTKYLKVNVECEQPGPTGISENMIDYLCRDNPHYDHMEVFDTEEGFTMMKALMFKPEVMHWYSDDMFSPSGHSAILPQTLASQIFYENLNYQTLLTE